jgi:hypothetical protein
MNVCEPTSSLLRLVGGAMILDVVVVVEAI